MVAQGDASKGENPVALEARPECLVGGFYRFATYSPATWPCSWAMPRLMPVTVVE